MRNAALSPARRRRSRRGVLLCFALLGQVILDQLGVSTPALTAAGGIVLMIIALDMIFA
jgi:multiple antibiotic resistance protein